MKRTTRLACLGALLVGVAAVGCSGEDGVAFRPIGAPTDANAGADTGAAPSTDAGGQGGGDAASASDAALPTDAQAPACDPLSAWSTQAAVPSLPTAPTRLRVSENQLVALWFDSTGTLQWAERAAVTDPFGAASAFFIQPGIGASVSVSPRGLGVAVARNDNTLVVYTRAALGTSFDPAQNPWTISETVPLQLSPGDVLRDVSMRGESGAYFALLERGGALKLGALSAPSSQSGAGSPLLFNEYLPDAGAAVLPSERLSFAPFSSSYVVTATATTSRLWRIEQNTARLFGPLQSFPYGDLSLASDACAAGMGVASAGVVSLSRSSSL